MLDAKKRHVIILMGDTTSQHFRSRNLKFSNQLVIFSRPLAKQNWQRCHHRGADPSPQLCPWKCFSRNNLTNAGICRDGVKENPPPTKFSGLRNAVSGIFNLQSFFLIVFFFLRPNKAFFTAFLCFSSSVRRKFPLWISQHGCISPRAVAASFAKKKLSFIHRPRCNSHLARSLLDRVTWANHAQNAPDPERHLRKFGNYTLQCRMF